MDGHPLLALTYERSGSTFQPQTIQEFKVDAHFTSTVISNQCDQALNDPGGTDATKKNA